MLQTIVIWFAVLVGLGIFGLLFWTQVQTNRNLERRVRAAESGGRALSLDESAAVRTWGLRKPGEPELPRWSYRSYRKRAALNRTAVLTLAAMAGYLTLFFIAVSTLGYALGFIAMFLVAQIGVGGFTLLARRKRNAEAGST